MLDVARRALPAGTPARIAEFFAYWSSLPRTGLLPQLADYLDRALPHLQPYVMMTDVVRPGEMRVRLMGTGLVNIVGHDATGKIVADYYSPEVLAAVQRAVREVLTRPAGYLCVRSVATISGRVLSAPSICLPIVNRVGAIPTFMSYTHVDESIASNAVADQPNPVQGLSVTHWIDLGAGIPA